MKGPLMSAFQCIQAHARAQEAKGSDPQPRRPGEPSSLRPRPGQPGDQVHGSPRPGTQPGQPGDQVQGPPRPGTQPGQPGDQGPPRPGTQPGQPGDQVQGPPRPGPQPRQPDDQVRGPTRPGAQPGQPDDRIRGFFDVFSRASRVLDLDALAGCFDETFLSSDAAGTRVVPRPAFLRALAGRAQMFADADIGPAELRQVTHQELDPHHVLVRTTWAAPRTDGSSEVALISSFLLRRDGDQLRIVVYINHQGLPS
jgi:hypothetical protein